LGRLEDKAAQVRKYSQQLLISLITFNPFSADLRLSDFTKKLEQAEKQLADLLEQISAKSAPQPAKKNPENPKKKTKPPKSPRDSGEESGEDTDEPDMMEEDQPEEKSGEDDDDIEIELSEDEDAPVREKSDEERKLEKVINFYKDAVQFISKIHRAVPVISKLLASKKPTDIQESIQFFVTANEFKIENAMVSDLFVMVTQDFFFR
jgi:condensin complex subunit 1